MNPGAGFRIRRATGAHSQIDEIQCSLEIPFQPTDMRSTSVRMQVWTQVDHSLVGLGCLCESSLLHQGVAKQTEIKRTFAFFNEGAGNNFCFPEPMQVVQHMSAEKQGFRRAWG